MKKKVCLYKSKAKSFNYLPINDKKDLPSDLLSYDHSQCINYLFLSVGPKELDQFENNPFMTSVSQEIKKFDKNDCVHQAIF